MEFKDKKEQKVYEKEKARLLYINSFSLELIRNKTIPDPTRMFNVGDLVSGNFVIKEVIDQGKIYRVSFVGGKTSRIESKETLALYEKFPDLKELSDCIYIVWHKLYSLEQKNSIISNKRIGINLQVRPIEKLLSMALEKDLDLNPDYQRGYVWSPDVQNNFLQCLFNNFDLGKFTFLKNSESMAILDGKQRLKTLLDFYLDLIPFNGLKFSELNYKDKYFFWNKNIVISIIENMSYQEALDQFLYLNRGGVPIQEKHINNRINRNICFRLKPFLFSCIPVIKSLM